MLTLTRQEMLNNRLELLYSDDHAAFYCKLGGSDTARLALDNQALTIAVEIYQLNGDIDSTIFDDLDSAFKCLEVTDNYYKHVRHTLLDLI